MARSGKVPFSFYANVRLAMTWHGAVRFGLLRRGLDNFFFSVRFGKLGLGKIWRGMARSGMARFGQLLLRPGQVRCGRVRLGMIGLGTAGSGPVWLILRNRT
jgi:hypothetical protein